MVGYIFYKVSRTFAYQKNKSEIYVVNQFYLCFTFFLPLFVGMVILKQRIEGKKINKV